MLHRSVAVNMWGRQWDGMEIRRAVLDWAIEVRSLRHHSHSIEAMLDDVLPMLGDMVGWESARRVRAHAQDVLDEIASLAGSKTMFSSWLPQEIAGACLLLACGDAGVEEGHPWDDALQEFRALAGPRFDMVTLTIVHALSVSDARV